MKLRHIKTHMKVAFDYAELSYATRKQVGCVIVKDDTIIGIGWNGMPADENNCCEDQNNITKPEVIHAEDNALRKLTRSSSSGENATAFVTLAPCKNCAVRLADAKISKVYYAEMYPTSQTGIDYLQSRGIEVEQLTRE